MNNYLGRILVEIIDNSALTMKCKAFVYLDIRYIFHAILLSGGYSDGDCRSSD